MLNNSVDSSSQSNDDDTLDLEISSVGAVTQPGQNDKNAASTSTLVFHQSTIDEPYEGQEFESEAAAIEYYCAYAVRMGFLTRFRDQKSSKQDGSVISRTIVCRKEGYDKPVKEKVNSKTRTRRRASTREGCRARAAFKKLKSGKWIIRGLIKEHSHELHALTNGEIQTARVFQVQADDNRVNELSRELVIERKRTAELRELINLLLNYIGDHTKSLSETVQCMVEKINKIDSETRRP